MNESAPTNYYALLGVRPGDSDDRIEQCYLDSVSRGGDLERRARCDEARRILRDAVLRRQYDEELLGRCRQQLGIAHQLAEASAKTIGAGEEVLERGLAAIREAEEALWATKFHSKAPLLKLRGLLHSHWSTASERLRQSDREWTQLLQHAEMLRGIRAETGYFLPGKERVLLDGVVERIGEHVIRAQRAVAELDARGRAVDEELDRRIAAAELEPNGLVRAFRTAGSVVTWPFRTLNVMLTMMNQTLAQLHNLGCGVIMIILTLLVLALVLVFVVPFVLRLISNHGS